MFTVLLKTMVLVVMLAFGYVLRRNRTIDAAFNRMLAEVLIRVFYPALIFSSLPRHFSWQGLLTHAWLPTGALLVMALGWSVGLVARRLWRQAPPATGRMLHFQCAMNNYSFLPLMLAAVLWDESVLALVVFSTLGSEVFVWTFGLQALTGRPVRFGSLKHLLSMPMAALAAALLVILIRDLLLPAGQPLPAGWMPVAGMLQDALRLTGQATIPVSAIIAGSRMAGLHPRHLLSVPMGVLTALRLLLIPGLCALLFLLLPLTPEVYRVLVVVAVMPCALTSITLAEVYHGDADFAAASVLATHAACILTVPLWLRLLGVA